MKKLLALLLALCMLLTLAACDADPEPPDDPDPTQGPKEITLEDLAGWWRKPDTFDGITVLYAFTVDPETGTVTSYDEYVNPVEEYPCWYDESGFTIDMGDFWGAVTYVFHDGQLLDGEGNLHYIPSPPEPPEEEVFRPEDLHGLWYKNGERDLDYEHLIIDEAGYRTEQFDIVTGSGTLSVVKSTGYYGDGEYTGPLADTDSETGFFNADLWILEGGNVLYDAFHRDYYIRNTVDDETWNTLCLKYQTLRDSWYCGDDTTMVDFAFYGNLVFNPNDGETGTSRIGTWEFRDGTMHITYDDGTTQVLEISDALFLEYYGKTYTRWITW